MIEKVMLLRASSFHVDTPISVSSVWTNLEANKEWFKCSFSNHDFQLPGYTGDGF